LLHVVHIVDVTGTRLERIAGSSRSCDFKYWTFAASEDRLSLQLSLRMLMNVFLSC